MMINYAKKRAKKKKKKAKKKAKKIVAKKTAKKKGKAEEEYWLIRSTCDGEVIVESRAIDQIKKLVNDSVEEYDCSISFVDLAHGSVMLDEGQAVVIKGKIVKPQITVSFDE